MIEIKEMVCKVFRVTNKQFQSNKRHREIVDARRCYSKIMNQHFNYGWSTLGRDLNRNHASIINLVKSHNNLYNQDLDYTELFNVCEDMAKILREPLILTQHENMIDKRISMLQSELEKQKNLKYEIFKKNIKILSKTIV